MSPYRPVGPAPTPLPEHPRRVALDGAVNFRDLGGYRASDGRRVRSGHIYRSDDLARLTDSDVRILSDLDVRTLCDLRSVSEQAERPDRVSNEPAVRIHSIPITPYRADELVTDVRAGKLSVSEIRTRVREIYRQLALREVAKYATLFEALLLPAALPAVVHCTSGRDRTGFGVALVLVALGVPRATIVYDFAISDRFPRDLSFLLGDSVSPEIVATLTQAHPGYLAAAFDTIVATWGSEQDYLRDALGLTADRLARLRSLLLEP